MSNGVCRQKMEGLGLANANLCREALFFHYTVARVLELPPSWKIVSQFGP